MNETRVKSFSHEKIFACRDGAVKERKQGRDEATNIVENGQNKIILHLLHTLDGKWNKCRIIFFCLFSTIFVASCLPCFLSFYGSIPTCKDFLMGKSFYPSHM